MIISRNDYFACNAADDEANGYKGFSKHFNIIRKYLHALRFVEYAQNAWGGITPFGHISPETAER